MQRSQLSLSLLIGLLASFTSSSASAQFFDFGVPDELGPEAGNRDFGTAIAIDGDRSFVAAPNRSTVQPGRVFVYGPGGELQQVIEAPGGDPYDRFGAALDVQPSRLIVGAPGVETAYVYSRVSGVYNLVGTLTPSGPTEGFGEQVALFGFDAWVSAPSADVGGASEVGVVYRYQSDFTGTWSEASHIDGPSARAHFGEGMTYSSGRLFVGAPRAGLFGSDAHGLVYVFRNDDTLLHTIEPTDTTPAGENASGGFGAEIVADGDRMVTRVSSDRDSADEVFRGSVMVYEFDGTTWNEAQRLRRPHPSSTRTSYAWGLALSGSTLLVHGLRNVGGVLMSSAFTYHHNGVEWREAGSIVAVDYQIRCMDIVGLNVLLATNFDGSIAYRHTFTLVPDTDDDRIRDSEDDDDDNDGVLDAGDTDPLDPMVCRDADSDRCDDCSTGTDGFGPMSDFDTSMDGPDDDDDGVCNTADLCVGDDALGDPDNDGICGDAAADAGPPASDAGPAGDAGSADAGPGATDAGPGADSGPAMADGGTNDAGSATPADDSSGCSTGGTGSPAWLALILFAFVRRRGTHL